MKCTKLCEKKPIFNHEKVKKRQKFDLWDPCPAVSWPPGGLRGPGLFLPRSRALLRNEAYYLLVIHILAWRYYSRHWYCRFSFNVGQKAFSSKESEVALTSQRAWRRRSSRCFGNHSAHLSKTLAGTTC